jgi:uncharacterized damage-inducible protein DinB
MSAPRNTRMLTRYRAWANAELFAALAELPEDELNKAQPIVFGSILRTLNHVYSMDRVWQSHLEGRAHGFTTRNPVVHPPFAELRAAQSAIDEWFIGYAEAISESAAEEIVDFVFIGGGPGSMSRDAILLHVVNHATYHRGHIADMMNRIPVHPPTTDLPVFLRKQPSR